MEETALAGKGMAGREAEMGGQVKEAGREETE